MSEFNEDNLDCMSFDSGQTPLLSSIEWPSFDGSSRSHHLLGNLYIYQSLVQCSISVSMIWLQIRARFQTVLLLPLGRTEHRSCTNEVSVARYSLPLSLFLHVFSSLSPKPLFPILGQHIRRPIPILPCLWIRIPQLRVP